MAGLIEPHHLVVRAYWANHGASDDYRPSDWRRPEFREGELARDVREGMTTTLMNDRGLRAAARRVVAGAQAEGGDRAECGETLARWLDSALYGRGKTRFPSLDDRVSLQLLADSYARCHFAVMDFGRLMDDLCAVEL